MESLHLIFKVYFSYKKGAVLLALHFLSNLGGPAYTNEPPFSPASGPSSITQSAAFITSILCSITIMVCPWLIKALKEVSSFLMSLK